MAVKSKSKLSTWCRWRLFLLVLIVLCMLSYYLWHKIYYQRTEGCLYFDLFCNKDTDKSSHTELAKTQVYRHFLNSIYDDLISCVTFLVLFLQTRLLTLLLFTCVVLSVIIYIIYYECIKKKQQADREPEKEKKTKGKNKSQTWSTTHESSQPISLSQLRKRYQRWAYGLLCFFFLVSNLWEFIRLYQSAVAEKVAQMKAGVPAECVPEEMTIFQMVQSFIRKQISWSDDPCLVYHKVLLVDPIWQVNPLMVVMSTFSRCVVHQAEILFGGLGKSFRHFFKEIPAQWQPFMLIVIYVVLFIVLGLIMICVYKVFLALFKSEPKSQTYIQTKSKYTQTTAKSRNISRRKKKRKKKALLSQLDH